MNDIKAAFHLHLSVSAESESLGIAEREFKRNIERAKKCNQNISKSACRG